MSGTIIRDRSRVWELQEGGEVKLLLMLSDGAIGAFTEVLNDTTLIIGRSFVEIRIWTVIE